MKSLLQPVLTPERETVGISRPVDVMHTVAGFYKNADGTYLLVQRHGRGEWYLLDTTSADPSFTAMGATMGEEAAWATLERLAPCPTIEPARRSQPLAQMLANYARVSVQRMQPGEAQLLERAVVALNIVHEWDVI